MLLSHSLSHVTRILILRMVLSLIFLKSFTASKSPGIIGLNRKESLFKMISLSLLWCVSYFYAFFDSFNGEHIVFARNKVCHKEKSRLSLQLSHSAASGTFRCLGQNTSLLKFWRFQISVGCGRECGLCQEGWMTYSPKQTVSWPRVEEGLPIICCWVELVPQHSIVLEGVCLSHQMLLYTT